MKKQVLHKASIFFIAAAIIFGLAPSALAEGKADGFANGNGLDLSLIHICFIHPSYLPGYPEEIVIC